MTGSVAPVDIRVTVPPNEIAPSVPIRAAMDAVRATVDAVVRDLAQQLDLPLAPGDVTVQPGPRATVSVNGTECGVLAAPYLLRHTSVLSDRVAQTVHSLVGLMLTPEVLRAAWTRLRGSLAPSPPWFAGLARDLVRHQVRLGRLAELLDDHAGDASALFEAALSAAGRPVRILVDERTSQTWTEDRRQWRELLTLLATGLFSELGLPVALPQLEVDPDLPELHFAVEVNDLRTLPLPGIPVDRLLVNDTQERLALRNIAADAVVNPATGLPAALTATSQRETLESMGLVVWTMTGYIVLTLAEIIRRNAAALLRAELLEYQLDRLTPDTPVLQPMIEAIGGTTALLRVLRRLLREEVPVTGLYTVVSTLYGAAPPASPDKSRLMIATQRSRAEVIDAPEIGDVGDAAAAETARAALSRSITHKYTRGTTTLVVYLLDSKVEDRLRDPAALTADERRKLLDMIHAEMRLLPTTAERPVILTRAPVRARLRAVIETELPKLGIVAYEELAGDLNIQPVARLSLTP